MLSNGASPLVLNVRALDRLQPSQRTRPHAFRWQGIVLGLLILFLTAALFATELGRVYTGSLNRGRNDSSAAFQYLINPDVVVGFNGHLSNPKLENRWTWPWSTATLLFSLLMFTTAALGVFSGVRQSYTTILTFFVFLVVSTCLLAFLIASYATILSGWKTVYGSDEGAMPNFARVDKHFSTGCLALACALFAVFCLSLVVAGRKIHICTEKDYPRRLDDYERLPAIPGTPIPHIRVPQAPPTPRSGPFRELGLR